VLCSNKRGWSAYSRRRYAVAGRSPYLAITVMVQRLSVPDPLSFTDRTTPVTVDPISFNVAFWPLYWA
jgi:hypothetical protein